MNFTHPLFLPFLVLTFIAWVPFKATGRKIVLILASWLFYGMWDVRILGVLFIVWLTVLIVPNRIEKAHASAKIWWKTLGVVSLLLVLFLFKYFDFFLHFTRVLDIGKLDIGNTFRVIVPIGVSFYTFQSISYILDVHAGKTQANKSLTDTALYVSFFPLLLAGPIERGSHWMPQVSSYQPFRLSNVRDAFERILLGYLLKVGIADSLAPLCNDIFARSANAGSGELIAGAFGYSLQILSDFAGYSLIARGVAVLFGYQIFRNFEQPYFSRSFSEFWRRWHISLSTWIWTYVFYPLISFVLKTIKPLNVTSVKTEMRIAYPIAAMGTMFLCGLWHGAGLTFIVWGLLHGVFLVIERLFIYGDKPIRKRKRIRNFKGLISAIVSTILVFTLTSFAWIVFRSNSISEATVYVSRILTAGGWVVQSKLLVQIAVASISILVIEGISYKRDDEWLFRGSSLWKGISYSIAMAYIVLFGGTSGNVPFIYFQF